MNVFNKVLDNTELFKDQSGRSFATVIKGGVQQSLEIIGGGDFENWLRIIYRKETGEMPSNGDIMLIIQNLEAEASFNGNEHHLYRRVGIYEGAFWYYTANGECQAVKILPNKWEIVNDNVPIIFNKSDLFLPQITPKRNGDFKKILDYVNIVGEENKMLFLISVASMILPQIQYPIMVLYGSQGSSKTTVTSMIRKLIDPSQARPSVMTKSTDEMCSQLSKSHLITYDNLDGLTKQQSDILCQAITGGSLEKRKLYTNGQTYLMNFQSALIINGISNVVNRSDLLDRAVLFELSRIDEQKRRGESELWESFDNDLSSILGGLFDVVSKALAYYPEVKPKKIFRMAEFTKWGCAIAMALGYSAEQFIDAYGLNRKRESERAIANDPLIEAMRVFMANITEWQGYVAELYNGLKSISEKHSLSRFGFPAGSNLLVNALTKKEVDLKTIGITFMVGNKGNAGRRVSVNLINP